MIFHDVVCNPAHKFAYWYKQKDLAQQQQTIPCLKKTVPNCFCHNFIKFPPTLIIFGLLIVQGINLCEVQLFSTSSRHSFSWDTVYTSLDSGIHHNWNIIKSPGQYIHFVTTVQLDLGLTVGHSCSLSISSLTVTTITTTSTTIRTTAH